MTHVIGRFLLAIVIPASFVTATADAREGQGDEPAAPVARKIADFSLRDYRGKTHSLADYSQSKLLVVAFVGCDCPVAKRFAPRLAKLSSEFGPQGVSFLAINSNSQDLLTAVAAFARIHEIDFPVLKDPGNVVADQFGATRTPEVFVLDAQRIVRYHGRVDDQYLVGVQRPHPTREDLKLAIEQLLSGESVSVPETPVVGCRIGRIPARKSGSPVAGTAVTYSEHIARLFQERCVYCHRDGEIAPFPLTTYKEVVGWGDMIREVVEQRRMPPWLANPEFGHFANDARLSDADQKLIFDWLDGGAVEGDPAKLPAPRAFTVGWQIPQPDQVFYISDQPVSVPAEGTVAYQYFTVDPGFTEDRWIQAAESRPGNRAVVHHIVVNFIPPGSRPKIGLSGAQVGFAPGIPPIRLPEGTAMFVPAGSTLLFQMHYTPNGSPQQDRSMLGLVFADRSKVRFRVDGSAAANAAFEIPPGVEDYEVQSQYRFNRDARLLTLMPHMHLRGKAFRYEAKYPDGSSEVLLDVPRYDFNWQLRYQLAEPKSMPKGTLLTCKAHFDNSTNNLANPDPTRRIRWGDQTWDEMMIGYFSTVAPADSSSPVSAPVTPLTIRDDPESQRQARALVRRGAEALGGEARLAERPVLSFKVKGLLYIEQTPMAFVGSSSLQPAANRFSFAVQGLSFKFAVVLDGDRGWIKPGDRALDLPHEGIEEQRERMHAETVALLYPVLRDDSYHLSLIVDGKLSGRAADAVLVKHTGHRDVRLFFDRETHLLGKTETEISEIGRDVAQETRFDDYAEFEGVQRPRKVLIRWDGVDRAAREMSDYHATKEPDAATFAKP